MFKPVKMVLTFLLVFGLLTNATISQADWKETLGTLWGETKEKAQKGWNALVPKKPMIVGIAYGTEKKTWMKWAIEEFHKTPAAKNIKINLIPMGSIEGAKTILKEDKRIHVWSPASSLIQALLTEPWEKEHGKNPFYSDAPLAITPMVIVMWADRYEAFMAKYNQVNFNTIAQALTEKIGWATIADKPQWGYFSFGHTMPTHSNSGLLTLALMAYDYSDISLRLTAKHIMDEGFLIWLKQIQDNISADESSTGKLMDQMLRFGPSELDAVMVYENLALSNLKIAEGRWGKIKVVYPNRSVWNDNPYYILDVPWSTQEHKNAAKLFQDFLLSEQAQRVARDQFWFRPANVNVPILESGSAFSQLQDVVKIDIGTIKQPKVEVLNLLIQTWKRNAD